MPVADFYIPLLSHKQTASSQRPFLTLSVPSTALFGCERYVTELAWAASCLVRQEQWFFVLVLHCESLFPETTVVHHEHKSRCNCGPLTSPFHSFTPTNKFEHSTDSDSRVIWSSFFRLKSIITKPFVRYETSSQSLAFQQPSRVEHHQAKCLLNFSLSRRSPLSFPSSLLQTHT